MKLMIGLGNPGKEYEKTRHNIGALILEELSRRWRISFSKTKFESLLAQSSVQKEKVLLALPQTYMNLSGRAVAALLSFYKLSPSEMAVVHDDLDLPLGKLKVTANAGPAGHRGIASIQELLGTRQFTRFRIGIGKPTAGHETVDFVLGKFTKEETRQLEPVFEKVIQGLEIWIQHGVEAAVQFCHQKSSPKE